MPVTLWHEVDSWGCWSMLVCCVLFRNSLFVAWSMPLGCRTHAQRMKNVLLQRRHAPIVLAVGFRSAYNWECTDQVSEPIKLCYRLSVATNKAQHYYQRSLTCSIASNLWQKLRKKSLGGVFNNNTGNKNNTNLCWDTALVIHIIFSPGKICWILSGACSSSLSDGTTWRLLLRSRQSSHISVIMNIS